MVRVASILTVFAAAFMVAPIMNSYGYDPYATQTTTTADSTTTAAISADPNLLAQANPKVLVNGKEVDVYQTILDKNGKVVFKAKDGTKITYGAGVTVKIGNVDITKIYGVVEKGNCFLLFYDKDPKAGGKWYLRLDMGPLLEANLGGEAALLAMNADFGDGMGTVLSDAVFSDALAVSEGDSYLNLLAALTMLSIAPSYYESGLVGEPVPVAVLFADGKDDGLLGTQEALGKEIDDIKSGRRSAEGLYTTKYKAILDQIKADLDAARITPVQAYKRAVRVMDRIERLMNLDNILHPDRKPVNDKALLDALKRSNAIEKKVLDLLEMQGSLFEPNPASSVALTTGTAVEPTYSTTWVDYYSSRILADPMLRMGDDPVGVLFAAGQNDGFLGTKEELGKEIDSIKDGSRSAEGLYTTKYKAILEQIEADLAAGKITPKEAYEREKLVLNRIQRLVELDNMLHPDRKTVNDRALLDALKRGNAIEKKYLESLEAQAAPFPKIVVDGNEVIALFYEESTKTYFFFNAQRKAFKAGSQSQITVDGVPVTVWSEKDTQGRVIAYHFADASGKILYTQSMPVV